MSASHQPAIYAAPGLPTARRAMLAELARAHTATLHALRGYVAERSGAENAEALHEHARAAFHQLLAAAGAYDLPAEVRGG